MPPMDLRAPPMVAGSSKRGKDRMDGMTNSGEVPFKEAMVPSEGRASRRGAAGAVDKLRAEKSAAELEAYVTFVVGCHQQCTDSREMGLRLSKYRLILDSFRTCTWCMQYEISTVGWARDTSGKWRSPYGRLNVGDSRSSSERVVALLIAHRTPSPDF